MEKNTSTSKKDKPDVFIIKSAVCLIMLAAVIAVRLSGGAFSQKAKDVINRYIGSGADYMGVIKAVGEAVESDGGIMQVFAQESIKVFGRNLIVPQDDDETEVNNAYKIDDAESTVAVEDDIPFGDYGEEDEPIDEELYSLYRSTDMPTSFMPILGDTQNEPYVITSSSAFASLSIKRQEVIDDTPATEFKIPSPDRVDETLYTLPFKYKAPIKGRVTSPFGYRDHPVTNMVTFHYGVDIAASLGDKIGSFAEGTVTETGTGRINGKYVIVTHKDGFWTRYCHLSKISVKKGQKVKIGEKIGEAGTTGMSTGVHLHFEVRINDSILNPADYVSFS